MARNAALFKGGPLRQLRRGIKRTGGRNNHGRVTAFHRGGGTKRLLRTIDTKRNVPGMVGTVERIEYDPFRTARTALIRWEGEEGRDAVEGKLPGVSGHGDLTTRRPRELHLPRGIHAVSRSELRSAVATICGVPLVEGARKRNQVTVTVDGRRKFSVMSEAVDTLFFQQAQSKDSENTESIANKGLACNGKQEEINMEYAVALSKKFQQLLKMT